MVLRKLDSLRVKQIRTFFNIIHKNKDLNVRTYTIKQENMGKNTHINYNSILFKLSPRVMEINRT